MSGTATLLTIDQVMSASLSDLANVYNELADKPIKKFKDKPTGQRRVLDILRKNGLLESDAPKAKAKPAKAKKAAAAKSSGTGTRRTDFNLEGAEEVRAYREGTKRAQVIDMLRKGATIEEVQDAIGWDSRTAREGIKLINTYVGFGLAEDEDGVITLVE